MKLGLGTVQFGLKYGINNATGKPELRQIKETLQKATQCGISLVDTAADYGESENNLGETLQEDHHFKIVTKTSKNGTARESLFRSLERLKRYQVYGFLIHDFRQFESRPSIWKEMVQLRNEGLITKAGFSLYLPEQLNLILNLLTDFDIVQIPYSILDQRFEKHFGQLKERGVEIHVRSVFVQGLVFIKTQDLHPFFNPIKFKLEELNSISKETRKSIENLCLNFVNANPYVDKIIVGVDTEQNLEQNVAVLNESLTQDELNRLRNLKDDNEQMILPYNWNFK